MAQITKDEIDNLNSYLKEIKTDISTLRKKGYDMSIAHMMVTNIPAKIKMVEATMEVNDGQKVRTLLMDARKEVDETKKIAQEAEQEK